MADDDTDLPRAMGKPAQRALIAAGYKRLADLASLSDVELLGLHGVGPKALKVLRAALAEAAQQSALTRSSHR